MKNQKYTYYENDKFNGYGYMLTAPIGDFYSIIYQEIHNETGWLTGSQELISLTIPLPESMDWVLFTLLPSGLLVLIVTRSYYKRNVRFFED